MPRTWSNISSPLVFSFPAETGTHRNVSLAAQTRSLPESNTDAGLKGGSEMAFSITMINIFSLVRAFSSPVMSPIFSTVSLFLVFLKEQQHGSDAVFTCRREEQDLSAEVGCLLNYSANLDRDPILLNLMRADSGVACPQKRPWNCGCV